jgi:DNA ligase (NAD+)
MVDYFERVRAKRADLEYDIDGVVFKVDDLAGQSTLAYRTSTPRFAIARKFPPDRKETRVRAINVSVGRTGAITPVVELEPVFVGGVMVRNATLHNEAEVHRKDVRVGDTVIVQRAGDVIPEIVEVVDPDRPGRGEKFALQGHCPVCGSAIVRLQGEVVARCSGGLICAAQRKQSLLHFSSRRAMNILGLGEGLVDVLVDLVGIRDPADLYELGDRVWEWLLRSRSQANPEEVFRSPTGMFGAFEVLLEQFSRQMPRSQLRTIEAWYRWRQQHSRSAHASYFRLLDISVIASLPRSSAKQADASATVRFGEANASNLLEQIDSSKAAPLHRIIFALGIRHVGEEIAKLLANEYGSLQALMDEKWDMMLESRTLVSKKTGEETSRLAFRKEARRIRGVGPTIIQSLGFFFGESHNKEAVLHLLRLGVQGHDDATKQRHRSGPLTGEAVVFTGKIPGLSKDELAKKVERLGGTVQTAPAKGTTTLVVYVTTTSKKYKTAERFGIKTEPADQFIERLASMESAEKHGH